jgi:hypothetical protein
MREIKFRVYYKQQKKMVGWEEVIGNIYETPELLKD